jgi:prophage DNA circulation protein
VQAGADVLRTLHGRTSAAIAQVDTIARQIDTYAEQAAALILTPLDLVSSLQALLVSVYGAVQRVRSAGAAVLALSLLDISSMGTLTGELTDARDDDTLGTYKLALALRSSTLAACAQASAQIDYESPDEAVQVRDAFVTATDALLPHADTALYDALSDLLVAVSRHLDDTAARLPALAIVAVTSPVPALLLAYALYDDLTRDAEIIARNRIVDPSLIPAYTTLTVLDA